MGEPLDNYDAVLATISAITRPGTWALASQRVCVSTVGIIPRVKQLLRDAPKISLALSLHAPTQETRLKIVPTAKAYRVDRIMDACIDFIQSQNMALKGGKRRHLLVEYVLIKDVNGKKLIVDLLDSLEIAAQLGVLLRGLPVLLNVIPY